MKCPECSVEMTAKNINRIEVDQCDQCKGTWYQKDELRQSKDSAFDDLNWLDFEIWKHEELFRPAAKKLPCPECEKALVAVDYSDTEVEINYCPACRGAWLEKGEFKQIVEYLDLEANRKSLPEYIKSSVQEGLEIVTGPERFASEWKDFATVLRLMQYRILTENPGLHDKLVQIQQINPIQ